MPYMDETGLAYYSGKLKPWIASQPVKTLPSSLYPWTLTDKASAVTCWPVGGTQLKPTVDYIFTEIPPSNGQPKAPDNPSTITGVNSVKVTRCGKNLLIPPYYDGTFSDSILTVTPLDDGSIKITKSVSTNNKYYNFIWETPVFRAGTTFIMSATQVSGTVNGNIALQLLSAETNSVLKWQYLASANTAYTLENDTKLRFRLYLHSPSVCTDLILKPQVELGATVTAYEKGEGIDYTLPLGSTYYGGTLDVATGVMTVTWVAVTPDASTVDISSAPAALPLDYADTYGRTITSADGTSLSVGSAGGTVVYKLATPQAVQLDPISISALSQPDPYTPRLNTVYTDASAVQVGYVKSPIREEYELQQAIVAQGGSI